MKRCCYLVIGLLTACDGPDTPPPQTVISTLSDPDTAGYSRALAPRSLRFPGDHGPHPDFKHEWWYLTGQATSETGHRFGYQFTLFRRALSPHTMKRSSAWASNQLYMAHLALTDITGKRFYHDERYAREALALAGVTAQPFAAWLEDWSLNAITLPCSQCLHIKVQAATNKFALDLSLRNQRDPVLHGENGLSRKSNTPGNASYYYSYPRLATGGTIRVDGRVYTVAGNSWFDHEWSTSALEPDQAGWDWFSLQLSDQTELMLFRLRHRDDPGQSLLSGTHISDDATRTLGRDGFSLRILEHWRSPRTAVRYPQDWRIEIPALGYSLTVTPWLPEQEIDLSFRYWEGAVRVSGHHAGRKVTGNGYMELTGYR